MNPWTASSIWSEHGDGPVVAGLGAVTPVGRSAWAAAQAVRAAVRAGISGFGPHGFMVDAAGKPMCVAAFPWLSAAQDVASRIGDSLAAAIRESLLPLQATAGPDGAPTFSLLVNLPSPRPGLPDDLCDIVREHLVREFPHGIERIGVAPLGHAGGMMALRSASEYLRATPTAVCIVAGADSYLDPDALEWIEDTDQLHSAGERNNPQGFVPGEGAGAMLLVSADTASRMGLQPMDRIEGQGLGREAHLIRTESVCIGEGLTAAMRGALSGLPEDERLTDVYCDLNGEPYRADEFAFAALRTRERFVAASDCVAPADCWGDVGAASAVLLVMLACIAGLKGYANGASALVWASSVTGERGAVVIRTSVFPASEGY